MADKSIFDLTTQATFANDDRLVIGNYANNDARAITGADMVAQLTALANGHGGISSITSVDSSLDGGTNVITVTMADGTTASFNVKNGSKGSTGAQTYVYIRYAHTQPTADADMTTTPDEWIGMVSTTATTAPTTYTSYTWYQFKGDTGATGAAASITTQTVEYQSGASGTSAPSGAWSSSVPTVAQGAYLWTRTTLAFNDGTSVVSYSVGRMGIDGSGSVSTVNNVSVDTGTTNITLEGSDIPIDSNNTANVAVITDANGKLAPSAISTTELNMLSGANSNIQTQINAKADKTTTESNLAYVESTSTASRDYSVGDYFVNSSGVLCKITAAVANGGTLTSGTNYTAIGGNGGLSNDITQYYTAMAPFTASSSDTAQTLITKAITNTVANLTAGYAHITFSYPGHSWGCDAQVFVCDYVGGTSLAVSGTLYINNGQSSTPGEAYIYSGRWDKSTSAITALKVSSAISLILAS